MRHLFEAGRLLAAGIILFVFAAATTAQAVELRLEPDQSKLVALAGEPATVIVGNPLYADVTVLDNRVVVQGRNFGKTSIIIMDSNGKQLASLNVIVSARDRDRLTVYKGGERFSYLCLPNCERTLESGDSYKDTGLLSAQMRQKLELAKSSAQINQ